MVWSCWQSVRYKNRAAAHVSDMKSIFVWYHTLVAAMAILHDATERVFSVILSGHWGHSKKKRLILLLLPSFLWNYSFPSIATLTKLSNDRPTQAHTLNISVFVLQTCVTLSWEKRAARPVWRFQRTMMSAITVVMPHWATALLPVHKKDKQGRPHRLWFKKRFVVTSGRRRKKPQDKAERKPSERHERNQTWSERHTIVMRGTACYSLCDAVPSAVCLLQKNPENFVSCALTFI